MSRKIFISFLNLLLFTQAFAQLQIKVVNINNKQPVVNAHIYDESKNLLGKTNDQGIFYINNKEDKILILADSFAKKTETLGKLNKTIYLFPPKTNPKSDPLALKIIQKSWINRSKNNPDFLENYRFNSYVKFTLDVPSDSVKYITNPKRKLDSLNNAFKQLLEKNLLFIGERIMVYKYDKKYGKKAIITAYKAGGLNNPELYNISMSQSMVNTYPEILKPKEIQNNVVKFIDSLNINGRKTYEILMYSKGKSETQFYRNLDVFVDAESFALVKILGNTSKISDVYYEIVYTPYQGIWHAESEYMKTKILSKNFINKINKILPKGLHNITKLTTTSTVESHFLNFESPVSFTAKEFQGYEYQIDKNVSQNSNEKIASLRTDSLTLREASTYNQLNKIFQKYKLESKLRFLRSLSSGELELSFFSLDLYNLFSHNMYESFRYQLGGHTNYKLSTNFQIGGYIAKATRDEDVKAGGEIKFFINKKQGGELSFKAETDVLPAGRTKIKYLTPKDEISAKSNNIYNDTYFSYRKLELSYQQDFFKNLDITFSVDYQRQRAEFDYLFKDYNKDTWFNFVNTAIRLRYAPKVKYLETPVGRTTFKDSPPYYYLTYSKSWNLFDHSTATHRLYLSAVYTFMNKLGNTKITGNLGAIFGETPIMNTYEGMGVAKHGHNLWGRFSVRGFQSFETMDPASFFSDKFASIQFTHYLRPIRVSEFKSLHFALIYNGLIGTMKNKSDHQLLDFDVPKDYYQEFGVEANKLLLGIIGVGVYCRLGAYQVSNLDKNLYIKLTLEI